jgi:hypothetical protein
MEDPIKMRSAPLPKGADQVYKTNLTNRHEGNLRCPRQSYNLLSAKQTKLTVLTKIKYFSL